MLLAIAPGYKIKKNHRKATVSLQFRLEKAQSTWDVADAFDLLMLEIHAGPSAVTKL